MEKISIISGILWATAIVAAAVMHAPIFFTIVLLPILASFSLASIQIMQRRSNAGSRSCL